MVCFKRELNLFCFSNLRYRNNKTYFRLLLLFSGNISFNPGSINGFQQYNNDQWAVVKKRGLHILHIDINSLLPKIEELQNIAKLPEATVIAISESKLDDSSYFLKCKLKIMISFVLTGRDMVVVLIVLMMVFHKK